MVASVKTRIVCSKVSVCAKPNVSTDDPLSTNARDNGMRSVNNALEMVRELALGGTAVGTGLNAPKGYSVLVANKIAELTGLPFVTANVFIWSTKRAGNMP